MARPPAQSSGTASGRGLHVQISAPDCGIPAGVRHLGERGCPDSVCNDGCGIDPHDDVGRAQRDGQSGWRDSDRLVRDRHDQPWNVQPDLWHGCPWHGRDRPRGRQRRGRVLDHRDRAHLRRDVLLLRDRDERHGNRLRQCAVVHDSRGTDRDDDPGRDAGDGDHRDPERLGRPGRRDDDGYFRYSTTNPTMCNITFGTAAPADRRRSARLRLEPVSYSQALTGLLPGDDLLLLCHRHQLGRNRAGLHPLVHHSGGGPHRHDKRRVARGWHDGHAQRLLGSRGRGHDRLVPLLHHQPHDLQHDLRNAGPGHWRKPSRDWATRT